jgi:ribonucleoside-diphosphate reductase alpha chain
MAIPFEDVKAVELTKLIFETIYHAAMETSMELARKDGAYESFKGSPLDQGKF